MNDRTRTILRLTIASTAALVAVVVAISQLGRLRAGSEDDLKVWFYDLSEQRLYAASRDVIPPHKGIGGPAGDGVHAQVVACPDDVADPAKHHIAYLETYAPELHALLTDVLAARKANRPYPGKIPSRDSDFFQEHTLVRAVSGDGWVALSSPEGIAIATGWRRQLHCAGDRPAVICTP
jgi:hypothetical protein